MSDRTASSRTRKVDAPKQEEPESAPQNVDLSLDSFSQSVRDLGDLNVHLYMAEMGQRWEQTKTSLEDKQDGSGIEFSEKVCLLYKALIRLAKPVMLNRAQLILIEEMVTCVAHEQSKLDLLHPGLSALAVLKIATYINGAARDER